MSREITGYIIRKNGITVHEFKYLKHAEKCYKKMIKKANMFEKIELIEQFMGENVLNFYCDDGNIRFAKNKK